MYNKMKKSEGDVTPGRDFHGTIVSAGCSQNYREGDHVVGVIHPLDNNGSLSQYINATGFKISYFWFDPPI